MTSLSGIPNIGKTLENKLQEIGINSLEELQSIGAENTFIKIKTIDRTVCINMLYALEGAVQGIRWHGISKDRKQELLDFFNVINK